MAFVCFPLLEEVGGSFATWYQLEPDGFAGFGNYTRLFADVMVPVSALHTVAYLVLTVPAEVALGLVAAWATLRVKVGRGLLTVVFLLPLAVPWTVAGQVFLGWFNVNGVADRLGHDLLGLPPGLLWLYHPRLAFGAVVALAIWKGAPWCYLLLLGALSNCPEDVIEAARVDGARGFTLWARVVLPSVRPMLAFVVALRLLAEAQAYQPVALLTNGGPSFPGGTSLIGFYANKLAFGYYNFGEASAMGALIGVGLVMVAFAGYRAAYPREGRRSRLRHLVGSLARSGRRATRPARGAPGPAGWVAPAHSAVHPRRSLGTSVRWAAHRRRLLLALMALLVLAPFAGEAPGWPGTHVLSGTNWPLVESGLWNSLLLSAVTVVGTLALAVPATYLLAYGRSRLRGPLFLFVLFTLAVPGVIFIYPQYEEIVRLGLVNTRAGMAVLYVTANLPLAVFFLRPAFAAVPRSLFDAMRVDGASNFTIVVRLVLRHAASTLVAVSVLTLVWVWGEYQVAQAVLSPSNQAANTLPLDIFNGTVGNPLGPYLLSLGPPLLLFFATQRVFRKGLVSSELL